jgi:hypothetical protein
MYPVNENQLHLNVTSALLRANFGRDELRQLCQQLGVPRGRNKSDAIYHIMSKQPILTITFTDMKIVQSVIKP